MNRKMVLLFFAVMILLVTPDLIFNKINASALSPKKSNLNLVAIGDSLTYGSGDPLKKGYIHRVKAGMERNFHISASLTNFGVSGYRTDQVITLLHQPQKQKAVREAHYIFLFIGTNDFRKSANYKFDSISVRKMVQGKQMYSNHLYELITSIRTLNRTAPLIVLGLYNPYTSVQAKETIDLLISDWNKEIKKTAASFYKTTYVPTSDLFPAYKKEYYFYDTLHPNPKGYQIIADRVLKYLSNKNSTQ
ncbi:GDSL-type esterase/lipase family protein [Bacillus taeanensis]|uniref:SGNH hydrolase-type esterase domain-containing protein n=1 Tax=Bacillus taeanensis TaxID=273032 RepID=A0A366Y041_9BACI|nr:GDSL-type esterase/lipase family protein [Bacillus taeanensis]RBW69531.1 hypothetical protein DS031_11460 [Bacillus taeanensis]